MADDSAQRAGQLKPSVDQIAEQFATSCGSSGSRREIRDLADDLLLDLIGTLGRASLGEIAQTVEALERRRRLRPPPAPTKRVTPSVVRGGVEAGERQGRQESEGPPGARDPFDITKPSELLDRVAWEMAQAKPSREEEPPASVTRMSRPERGQRVAAPPRVQSSAGTPPPSEEDKRNVPERMPAIVLREGEQLVRSTSSGVVIRRIRSA